MNCSVSPLATDEFNGASAIDVSVAWETVSVAAVSSAGSVAA